MSVAATLFVFTAHVAAAIGRAPGVIGIEHVTVVSMRADGAVLHDQTVLIEGGRISLVAPSKTVDVPRGAKRVDGSGKFVLPGLADMHTHVMNGRFAKIAFGGKGPDWVAFDTQDLMTPYLANGITQIFDPAAWPETIGQREEIRNGRVLGPHLATAGLIDGGPRASPLHTAQSPNEGRCLVRAFKTDGYDAIKVYSHLDPDTYAAIVDESRKLGLKVVGHIPNAFRKATHKAFIPGFSLVAHAEELGKQAADSSDEEARRFAQMARENGTWLTATAIASHWVAVRARSLDEINALQTIRYLPPIVASWWRGANGSWQKLTPERADRLDSIAAFNAKVVRAFAAAGAPVLTGTDSPLPGVMPGFSLHDELEMLAAMGLPNAQILAGSTRLAAQWLGVAADRGTVEAGKRADLLLLDADPLADVANTRRISAVVLNGRWLSRKELDRRMEDLARRNAAASAAGRAAAFEPVAAHATH